MHWITGSDAGLSSESSIYSSLWHMRAAWRRRKELAISQPAVSRAIADMEHSLGVPIFDRSPQGIEPTSYGRTA